MIDIDSNWHNMQVEQPIESLVWFIPKPNRDCDFEYGWACPAKGCIRLRWGSIHFSEVKYWLYFEEGARD